MNEPAPSSNAISNTANTQRIQVDSAYVGDWKIARFWPDRNNTDEMYSADVLADAGLSNVAISIRSDGEALFSFTSNGKAMKEKYLLENRPAVFGKNVPKDFRTDGYYLITSDGTIDAHITTDISGQGLLCFCYCAEDGSLESEMIAFSKS